MLPLVTRSSTSVAPRFIVIPQSPSPTMVSYLVRSASASPKLLTAFSTNAFDDSPNDDSVTGGIATVGLAASPTTTSGRSLLERRRSSAFQTSQVAQAGASQGASNKEISWSLEQDKFRIVTEAPCMSKDVMKLPTSSRVTLHPTPSASKCLTHALAKMDISKLDVPPRLFTKTQRESPFSNNGTISPSSLVRPYSRIVSIISFAISSAVNSGDCFIPASPWMPSPISMVLSPRRLLTVSAPGMVTESRATPRVPMRPLTSATMSTISSRLLPATEAAPAILCTRTHPATPLAPVIPLVRSRAQSSATTTMRDKIPSWLAFSHAMPKLSRSPV
mmetsp:Transcript_16451/g.41272  ORF Transcript_16451/g.41272 Transcript_16451/m.41272 type:complete len:333 (+) Transcript_16451:502-1500(+)